MTVPCFVLASPALSFGVRRAPHCVLARPQVDYTLYLITDSRRVRPAGRPLAQVVEEAVKGGVSVVQLREKGVSVEEVIRIGRNVRRVTQRHGIPLIVNDNVEAAIALGADGVHVGQDDTALAEVRDRVGEKMLVGVSAGNVEEAVEALRGGADYVGVGAVFRTASKSDAGEPIGLEGLKRVVDAVGGERVVAIGGIGKDEIARVSKVGVAGVAVISAIMGKMEIEREARELRKLFMEGR